MSYRVDSLQPGDILLITSSAYESLPARVLDWLISRSEASPFVHACLVGDGHLIDPLWRGERAPLNHYAANGWAFRVSATNARRAAAVAWAEAHVGNPYGIAELFADGARLDLHLVLPSWYRWRPQRLTCSGFVAAAWAAADVTLTEEPLPKPADLGYSPLLVGRRPWEQAPGGIAI